MFVINKEMMDYAEKNVEKVELDYKRLYEEVGQSNAVYKGKQLPFLYYPAVYSEKDVQIFQALTEEIFKIVNKSIDVYLKHPEVRHVWDFDKKLEALIEVEPRFKVNVPMGRFDFFYYPDGSYKFCELNTDGTSAMNEETPLTDILIHSIGMNHMGEKYGINRYELYHSWVDEVDHLYQMFLDNGGEASEIPYVVIMDYYDKSTPHEFKVFESVFKERGYKCDIVSPEKITEKEGYLYYNHEKIDIIYRRLVTKDMMEHYDELLPLINGILANKTCIIGSIRSQIVHTKKYFEALHHGEVRKFFSKEELNYIDQYIPFTKALKKDQNFEKYVRQKDRYIIKPIDYYASKGVYAGREFSEEQWTELLNEGIHTGYIIQEFCEKSVNQNLYFEDGHFEIREFNHITGLFMYNEKMKGIFTRAGFNAVISDLNDGYSLSSVVVKK
ncbi:MAG: hypothetical protein JXR88_10855 [Clostridia bacterium]|nr:hypothetical protein [Clostridia bacterium]